MRIAVAGGTGTVGRHIVSAAQERGHEVAVLSRSTGIDLLANTGVHDALAGCEVVVDALGTTEQSAAGAGRFFIRTARSLQSAALRAGVRRVVLVSIVGIDRASGYGYYRAKLEQERTYRGGGVPLTILRSTQFHEFPGQILRRTRRGPVAVVPQMRTQPIAARTAAAQVLGLVEGDGAADLVQIGGPEPADLADLARQLLEHRGERVRVLAIPVPGDGGLAMRDGALLPGPEAALLGPTFEEWLAAGPR
jgi:uncharacterized protein YbjT (DUF2867 family)